MSMNINGVTSQESTPDQHTPRQNRAAAPAPAPTAPSPNTGEGGIHYTTPFGDRVDISRFAVEQLAGQADLANMTEFDLSTFSSNEFMKPYHLNNTGLMWGTDSWRQVLNTEQQQNPFQFMFQGQRQIGQKIDNILSQNKISLSDKQKLSITVDSNGSVKVGGVSDEKAKKIAGLIAADKSLVNALKRQAFGGEAAINQKDNNPSAQAKRAVMDTFVQENFGVALDEFDLDSLSEDDIIRINEKAPMGWAYEVSEAQKGTSEDPAQFTFNYANGILLDERLSIKESLGDVVKMSGLGGGSGLFDPLASAMQITMFGGTGQGGGDSMRDLLLEQMAVELQFEYGARGSSNGNLPTPNKQGVTAEPGEAANDTSAIREPGGTKGSFALSIDSDGNVRMELGENALESLRNIAKMLDGFTPFASKYKERAKEVYVNHGNNQAVAEVDVTERKNASEEISKIRGGFVPVDRPGVNAREQNDNRIKEGDTDSTSWKKEMDSTTATVKSEISWWLAGKIPLWS